MNRPEIVFVEEGHKYFVDGKLVPSVTQVLSDLVSYSGIPANVLKTASEKGIAVHRMVELEAKKDLDRLPEWMEPVLKQWQKFRLDTRFEMIASEKMVYHSKLQYCGTLDLRGIMHCGKLKGHGILDIKRSFLAGPVTGLQTAGYAMAEDDADEYDEKIKWRGALKLNENGPYRLEIYDDPTDYATFMACVVRWKYKKRHDL
jgi:hypothetical protein